MFENGPLSMNNLV